MGFNPIQDGDWQGLNIALEQLFFTNAEAATKVKTKKTGTVSARKTVTIKNDASSEIADGNNIDVKIQGVDDGQGVSLYVDGGSDENVTIPDTGIIYKTQAKIAVPSGYYLNLIGAYLTAATRKYSASAIVLADANSNTVTILNMDITNNVGTAGPVANGRDVAAAFLYPGWVYFYAIYNPVTGDIASLSSKEKTTPTLPSGYTFYRRLGSSYLNGSGNLITTTQYGNRYSDTTFVLEDGDPDDADTWQALDIRTAVPPTAKSVFGYFGVTANTVAEYGMAISSVNSIAGGIGVTIPIITVNASTDYQPVGGTFFELNLPEEYTLYWKASATGARYGVKIIGFIDDL